MEMNSFDYERNGLCNLMNMYIFDPYKLHGKGTGYACLVELSPVHPALQ